MAPPREVYVEEAELLPRLATWLDEIDAGAVVVATRGGERGFVLGSEAVCGAVFGLLDPEYGWPQVVQLERVRTVDELRPRHRSHPVLVQGQRVRAIAVGWGEYELIRARTRP